MFPEMQRSVGISETFEDLKEKMASSVRTPRAHILHRQQRTSEVQTIGMHLRGMRKDIYVLDGKKTKKDVFGEMSA